MARIDRSALFGSIKKALLPVIGVVLGLVLCHFWPDSNECKLLGHLIANGNIRCDSKPVPVTLWDAPAWQNYACFVSSSTI